MGASGVFLREFLRRPAEVASMVPSTRWLERQIVRAAAPQHATTAVELGPGTGGTTRGLLAAMPASARLLSVEVNEPFVASLRGIEDDRLLPHCGSATDLEAILAEHGLDQPQLIVSGIPFSKLDRRLGAAIIDAVNRVLAPGGVFVAYQLSRRVEHLTRPVMGAPEATLVWRSIPPIRVFRWQKAG